MDWKKMLRLMKLEDMRKNHPDFYTLSGGESYKIKPYTDSTANGLTRAIEDFVLFSGGYVNRISTTGVMRKINGQMKWSKGNTNKGAADIRILIQGKSFDVEVKIGKDRQSEAQKKEQERITRAGGVYVIVHSFPEFLECWQTWGFSIPLFINN